SGCLINDIGVPRCDGNALDEVGRQIRQITADEMPGVTVIVAAIHPADVGSAVKATGTVRNDLLEPTTAITIDLLKVSRNSRVSCSRKSSGAHSSQQDDERKISHD